MKPEEKIFTRFRDVDKTLLTPQEKMLAGGKFPGQSIIGDQWYIPTGQLRKSYSVKRLNERRKHIQYVEIKPILAAAMGFQDKRLFINLSEVDLGTGQTYYDPKIFVIEKSEEELANKTARDVTHEVYSGVGQAIDFHLDQGRAKRLIEGGFSSSEHLG